MILSRKKIKSEVDHVWKSEIVGKALEKAMARAPPAREDTDDDDDEALEELDIEMDIDEIIDAMANFDVEDLFFDNLRVDEDYRDEPTTSDESMD